MRHQIFAGNVLGAADLSTAEGRREAGRTTVQAQGAVAAAAACSSTGVGAVAAATCGVIGSQVAGALYDYGEKYGEKHAEQAYNWASDQVVAGWNSASNWAAGAGEDVASFLGFGGGGDPPPPPPHFFNSTDEGNLIVQLPPVRELLAGAPNFKAPADVKALSSNPTRQEIMSSSLGPGVEAVMRKIMGDWNAQLQGALQLALAEFPSSSLFSNTRKSIQNMIEHEMFDIDAVVAGVERSPSAYHPYNFSISTTRAGNARNAIASYVLLQMIAADAAKPPSFNSLNLVGSKAIQDLFSPKKPGPSADAQQSRKSWGPWLLAFLGVGAAGATAYWYKKKRR